MNKRKLVLSTKFLTQKDELVIKSLCKLLSDKLKASWSVSSKADKGDLIICSREQYFFVSDNFNSQLNLGNNNDYDGNSLCYPFRSEDFVEKLNSISS